MNTTTIEQLESRGFRVLQDGSGVIVITGEGRNVRAFSYPSLEVAHRSLIDRFPERHEPLQSLREAASEREEARQ